MNWWTKIFSKESGSQRSQYSLDDLLKKYLRGTMTGAEKRQFVRDHNELLSPEADRWLSHQAAGQKTEDARSLIERARSELNDCKARGIDQALADKNGPPAGSPNTALLRTLSDFMNAGSLEQMKAMATQHPELLGPEAEELLNRHSNERTARHLGQFRQLFDLCRRLGVDAGFAEVERQKREAAKQAEMLPSLLKVTRAKNLGDIEQAIRQDPRVVDQNVREHFRNFLVKTGTLRPPNGHHIQKRLDILDACGKNGIDATFEKLKRLPPDDPAAVEEDARYTPKSPSPAATNPIGVFNSVIQKFQSGGKDAEVAGETLVLFPTLPQMAGRSCILLAMIANYRIGNHAQARKLAVYLNQSARGWDLPGIPTQVIGVAVAESMLESQDLNPILDVIGSMSNAKDGTPQEQEAIKSLLAEYSGRKQKS